MANAPIPPLFCSTPPPIDDEAAASPQNDGEFGDFSSAYQDSVSDYIENDVNEEFNDFSSSVPAYFEANSNLKTAIPDLYPTSPSIPSNDINCDTNLPTHSENVESENNELQHHKKTTSLNSLSEQQPSMANSMSTETKSLDKLTDSIRLDDEHSNDKNFGDFQFGECTNEVNKDDSGRSSQSDRLFQDANETNVENLKCVEPLANMVVLEDVPDDESDDERLSPRNRNNFQHCNEESEDFFALQPVDSRDHVEKVDDEERTIDLEHEQLESQNMNHVETQASLDAAAHKEVLSEKESKAELDVEVDTVSSINIAENTESEDEFANFQDFSTSDNAQSEWKASFENPTIETTHFSSSEDKTEQNDINVDGDGDNYLDGDDDDDFGDFSEAPIAPASLPNQTSSLTTTQPAAPVTQSTPQHVEAHVKAMLELMFPKSTTTISDSNIEALKQYQRTKNCLELASVESAKALGYQWIGSNMRHTLIKSLGIDSRNIFLTEKWNPSMPRFAANLSFDPLQPLKPTSVPLQPEVVSSGNQKTAVPVAEFDWQSSGLVNPLDGSKAEMAPQSVNAPNTESSTSNVVVVGVVDNDVDSSHTNDDDTSNASSTYASAEASTIAAPTAGATLPPATAAGGHIDPGSGTDDKKLDEGENTDVDYFECSNEQEDQSETNHGVVENVKEFNEDLGDQVRESSNSSPIIENQVSTTQTFETTTVTETEDTSDVHFESVAISRSTFAGPLKETHIFTPTKSEQLEEMRAAASSTVPAPAPAMTMPTGTTQKVFPIDFDYEKAAAGIIIDETVVRKEYRDVEYNPGFSLAVDAQTTPPKLTAPPEDDFDDEFSDFQSVPPPAASLPTVVAPAPRPLGQPASTAAAKANGMILCPAILLPQAISIESKQPKIEWGDSAANIDPDELARIEQLFPQEKSNSRNDSRKSTPTHNAMPTNSLSISASIANQQQQQQQNSAADDDDWSDFVSVPIAPSIATATTRSTFNTAQQQQSPYRNQVKRNLPTANNDDEWSDFVSSTPSVPHHFRAAPASFGLPQFNSGSWQNANFYNNPLSIYHRNHTNAVPNATPNKLQQQNNNYNNHNNNNHNHNYNNNNNYNNNQNRGSSNNNHFQQQHQQQQQAQYLSSKQQRSTANATAQQLQQQQQIQIMQDFSTSPAAAAAAAIPSTYRPNMMPGQSANYATGATPAAFQVGSAKVAPTVSLIPDLGFVAPAMPVHTAIINALPKPSTTAQPRK